MGYTTDFYGYLSSDKPFEPKHTLYLRQFNVCRRMKRDPKIAETLPDPYRIAVDLPIGRYGEYFVGMGNIMQMQSGDKSVLDTNTPPTPSNDWYPPYEQREGEKIWQPGLWCGWTVGGEFGQDLTDNEAMKPGKGSTIIWDSSEKFYSYAHWLNYLLDHFIEPWGYVLNGEIEWQGEERDDRGILRVTDNILDIGTMKISYSF